MSLFNSDKTTCCTHTLKDGTIIYYKDWGNKESENVVVLHHGWPLCADAFDSLAFCLSEAGYRVIVNDRRGHGRSSQPWEGHDMDHYADDVAELLDALDIKKASHFGHSTGGGVVARFVLNHGADRVEKAGLLGAVPPIMIKTDFNPNGTDKSVFDGIRAGVKDNSSQFYLNLAENFYNFDGSNKAQEKAYRLNFWRQGMMGGLKPLYDCVKAFSETDQREDLKAMTMPTLVMYGNKDKIVPPISSSEAAIKILPNPTVKVLEDAGHGLCETHHDIVNQTILEFLKTN